MSGFDPRDVLKGKNINGAAQDYLDNLQIFVMKEPINDSVWVCFCWLFSTE